MLAAIGRGLSDVAFTSGKPSLHTWFTFHCCIFLLAWMYWEIDVLFRQNSWANGKNAGGCSYASADQHWFGKTTRWLWGKAFRLSYLQSALLRSLYSSVAILQMYPFPIPDLFCGNPLVVSGKYQGTFPDSITIFGLMPDQSTWQLEVPSRKSSKVPLNKVFAKQQLDLLTGQAWLYEDKSREKQVSHFLILTTFLYAFHKFHVV